MKSLFKIITTLSFCFGIYTSAFAWVEEVQGSKLISVKDATNNHKLSLYCSPNSGMTIDFDGNYASSLEINGQSFQYFDEIPNHIDNLKTLKVNGVDFPVDGLSKFRDYLIPCQFHG